MECVDIRKRDPQLFSQVVGQERADALALVAGANALERLQGRSVININSTAAGGGVAEMLHVLLGYVRGVGIDARWLVIGGSPTSSTSPNGCTTICTAPPATAAHSAPRSTRSIRRRSPRA